MVSVEAFPAERRSAPDPQRPRVPGLARRFRAQHPRASEAVLLVAVLLVSGVADGIVRISGGQVGPGVRQVAVTVFVAAPLVVRRTRPVLSFTLSAVVLLATLSQLEILPLPTALAAYSIAAYRSNRVAWVAVALASAAITAVESAGLGHDAPIYAVIEVVTLLVGVVVGLPVGTRRRYVGSLLQHAGRLEWERDQQARLAQAAERARIAREMHDIISHSLTVVVTLAEGAAAAVPTAPDDAVTAMKQAAVTARRALADTRRTLGVLETAGTAEAGPQPTVADLPELVDAISSSAFQVTLQVRGAPPEDAGQQLAIYRIVQEGLTNAMRYGDGARTARVRIDCERSGTTVTVENDGLPTRIALAGGGRGIVGMQERVALYRGSLHAGPLQEGGWRVRAILPNAPESTTA